MRLLSGQNRSARKKSRRPRPLTGRRNRLLCAETLKDRRLLAASPSTLGIFNSPGISEFGSAWIGNFCPADHYATSRIAIERKGASAAPVAQSQSYDVKQQNALTVNDALTDALPANDATPRGSGASETVTMYGNTPPVANDDYYVAYVNTTLVVPSGGPFSGLLDNDWDSDGDPLDAICGGTTDEGGTVTCAQDGSFVYTPPANYVGPDTFTYAASDGQDQTDAIAHIALFRPLADIDVDSNNDEWIDSDNTSSGTDDPIEEDSPGQLIAYNDSDDNNNLTHDLDEAPFLDSAGNPQFDAELTEARLSIDESSFEMIADRPDFSGFEVVLSYNGGVKVWDTREKQTAFPSGSSWTIGPGTSFPSTVYAEGIGSGAATLTMTLNSPQDLQIHQDTAGVTVINVDVDVDSDNSETIDGSKDEDEVEEAAPGAVVPLNDDDDNENGTPDYDDNGPLAVADNELLPAELSYDAGGADLTGYKLRLSHGSSVELWTTQKKDALVASEFTIGTDTIPTTIYVEGIDVGQSNINWRLEKSDPRGFLIIPMDDDSVTVTVINADIDIDTDSDNDNGLAAPERNQEEEEIEDDSSLPGKYVAANISDEDQDGIPGFADGFDLNETGGDDDDQDHAAQQFTPLVLEIPDDIDLQVAKIRITYAASDPAGVIESNGTYTPAAGYLRIWTKDGSATRDKAAANTAMNPGDYVASDEYTPGQLGLSAQNFVVTLYMEGIRPSTALGADRVLAEIDPDGSGPIGFDIKDAVRVTVVNVDLDIDSDNEDGFGPPDRDLIEAAVEDINGEPGKRLLANYGDKDADGVPDRIDGYDLDSVSGNEDDENSEEQFVPIVLEIPQPIDLSVVEVMLDYEAASLTAPVTGALRIWDLQQPSDAQQRTASEYLAAGTYSAAQLGFSGSARTRTLYVEGIEVSNDIGDHEITVRIDPDGNGPSGFLPSDTVRTTVAGVQILDATMTSAEELKVAKWQNGYSGSPPTVKPDFIDLDPDRFYVRVGDVAENIDPMTKEHVYIQLSTQSPGNGYDDDETFIKLTETGVDTGIFITKSMMLMGDDVDDDHEVDGIVDDGDYDRTHKIALDGRVQIKYGDVLPGTAETAIVPIKKILTIPTIYILRDDLASNGGQPVTTKAEVEADVKWANERYAQAGVAIDVSNIAIVDPPTGVDLTDGSLDLSSMGLSAEMQSLFNGLASTNKMDVGVFYVNKFSALSTLGVSIRESVNPSLNDKYVNNLVVGGQHTDIVHAVFSHELLHVVGDTGTHPAIPSNLLYSPSSTSFLDDDDVNKMRRMSPTQATDVRTSKFVSSP